jgi:hypothetical protein
MLHPRFSSVGFLTYRSSRSSPRNCHTTPQFDHSLNNPPVIVTCMVTFRVFTVIQPRFHPHPIHPYLPASQHLPQNRHVPTFSQEIASNHFQTLSSHRLPHTSRTLSNTMFLELFYNQPLPYTLQNTRDRVPPSLYFLGLSLLQFPLSPALPPRTSARNAHFLSPSRSERYALTPSCPERQGGVQTNSFFPRTSKGVRSASAILRKNCALTPFFAIHAQKQGGGRVSEFLTRNSALILESLLSNSDVLFVRSFRSFTKECSRTPVQSARSALFFNTAGCVGISNQILAPETFPHPPSYLFPNAQGGIRL